jgi:tripartite-type tricarboxylate transporter receptor subunit TctC
VQYYGLVAPAKTPKEIVARLNAELNKVLAMPDIKQRLVDDGGAAMPSTPAQYATNIKDNESKWAALIKKLGLVVK